MSNILMTYKVNINDCKTLQFTICVDGLYEFQIYLFIYLLHFIKNNSVGSLFMKTGLSPSMILKC